jgi:arylsulfatase A-like enzyme
MIRTDRWKYIHFKNYPPQLFDLAQDPDEFIDLGSSPDHVSVRAEMKERLFERLLDRRNRVTLSDAEVLKRRSGEASSGIVIGRW